MPDYALHLPFSPKIFLFVLRSLAFFQRQLGPRVAADAKAGRGDESSRICDELSG